MAKYTCRVQKDKNGYYFILCPNNNSNQPLGKSIYYNDPEECEYAWEGFKLFVKNNKIDDYKSEYVNVIHQSKGWSFEYIKDNKVIFSGIRSYQNESEIKEKIKMNILMLILKKH